MKRYRDPTPALQRPKEEMPLRVRIICGIAWAALVLVAVYVSTRVGRQ